MKKILVPTDLSAAALDALKAAADIARKQNGSALHLIHVYERPVSGISLQFEIDHPKMKEIRKFVRDKMEALADLDFMRGIDCEIHILADKEVWEFYREKNLNDADLIVMGTHGVKGWRTAFIGSNTHKVVQTSPIPVLTIKEHLKPFDLKNIIYASSFENSEDQDFKRIKPLIDFYGASLHLLRVNTQSHFECSWTSRWAMEAFAQKYELTRFTTNIFNDDSIEEGIIHFSNTVENDLIAMVTNGRTDFKQLFNPSITERIVNMVWKPVLSILKSEGQLIRGDQILERKKPSSIVQPVPGGLIV